ncbi:MAG: EAL domain-containing protein [Candidatus Contendobacter sp.]|nr:EAL domain-containing protein [Candidatus Contendobacter sp.]MDG4557450.1 EAL domain-containing protein [Candidatus Contendobacter sp.]
MVLTNPDGRDSKQPIPAIPDRNRFTRARHGWSRIQLLALGLGLAGFWGGAAPAPANASPAPVAVEFRAVDLDQNRLGFWLGGGLVALGLAGGVAALFLDQRRRLWRAQRQLASLSEETRRLAALEAENARQRQAVDSLRDSERRLRVLTEQLPVGVFLVNLQGQCRYVNDRWRQMAGLTAEQPFESGWISALHPDDRESVLAAWRQAIEGGSELLIEHRFRTSAGQETWLSTHAAPLRDSAGRVTGYLGAHTDITERKRIEETLRANELRFRSYFELPLIGIAMTGPDKRWREINGRLCEMLGYPRAQLQQLTWAELTHPEDLPTELAQFERVMNRRIESYALDKRFIRADGKLIHVHVSSRCLRRANGAVEHFVTVAQDVTERKRTEERFQNLAQYDALTGLPNRALLTDRLRQAVRRAGRDHTLVGVLLVDLDRFKRFNDTLGHTIGDQLLRDMAARLQQCVRECDTVSRQGGDEFAVLLPDLATGDDAAWIAQRMLDVVAQPCRLDDHELHATCSIGISLYPRDGRNTEILLRNADIALYRAKDMGRNNYQFYLSGATVLSRERLNLETHLRHAVKQGELELYYQPKWDFRAGAIRGAEALIRWNHPELGQLSPVRFIPIAEDSGLILQLGEWVLRTAVRDIGQLHRSGFPRLRVAVNLSARQFRQANLAELVREVLAESAFEPACLELELTETILMNPTDDNLATLKAFKDLGARVAIDDFGTGYSSLSYLQRFPLDVLKIDQTFVKDLPASTSSVAITNAILTLAHGLKLEVVAEGVETVEQLAFLRDHGCDEGQGYYFGRPTPLAEFKDLLERDRARAAATLPLPWQGPAPTGEIS